MSTGYYLSIEVSGEDSTHSLDIQTCYFNFCYCKVVMSVTELRGLHSVREHQNFSHEFFENLGDLEFEEFDNCVVGVNVVYSIATGRKFTSDLFEENNYREEAMQILGRDSFEYDEENPGIRRYKSTPYSRAHSLADLAEDTDLYMPDITDDCLDQSQQDIRNRDEITRSFEGISTPLEAKEVMGIESYTREELEDAELRDEDLATARAADRIDGNTVIVTYDNDFFEKLDREEFKDSNIYATVPEFAQTLNNSRNADYKTFPELTVLGKAH